ncbi:MAG: aspartate racemase [Cryomorphaceae bacterium]|jgi:aspartate racemase
MKTIGLIGGMSWESTTSYYQEINRGVASALGGFHSARIALYSVDFDEIEKMQSTGAWDELAEILSRAAQAVEAGGADFFLICTNTMHKVAAQVEASVSIPLLHIADATARQLQADGVKKVGLLGTAFTMEQDFYKQRLRDNFGIDVVVPNEEQRQDVHKVIYSELCQGVITNESKERYLEIVDELYKTGAQAVILGCTEIGLLINQGDTESILYDTTVIHAAAAVSQALS